MQQQEAEMENRAADWTIRYIFALQARNPEMDLSDLPGKYLEELATLAQAEAEETAQGPNSESHSEYVLEVVVSEQEVGDQLGNIEIASPGPGNEDQ